MTQLSTTENEHILEEARTLVVGLEKGYYTLAVLMVKIKNEELYKAAGYETWVDYYEQDLKREKTTVSRLLTCGEFIVANGLQKKLAAANIPYRRLSDSVSHFTDKDGKLTKDPEYILSVAETWNPSDYKQERKDNCSEPDLDLSTTSAKCRNCGMWHKIHDA